MGQMVNVGAKRLGDESKIKQRVHGFDRANFDLTRKFRTTMNVGTLFPCYKELVTAGTTVELNEKNDVKTLPTVGPLFGSFKLQTDYFFVPLRLYMSTLHNNQLNIGLQMNKVKLPKLMVENVDVLAGGEYSLDNFWNPKGYSRDIRKLGVNNANVLHYLGFKGAIKDLDQVEQADEYQYSKLNAVPLLGMYDIFKNYYSNKQEEYCYMNTGVFQVMGCLAMTSDLTGKWLSFNYGYKDTVNHSFTTNEDLGANAIIRLFIQKDKTFTPTVTEVENRLQTILERVYIDVTTDDGVYPSKNLWELTQSKELGEAGLEPIVIEDIDTILVADDNRQLPELDIWKIDLSVQRNDMRITRISWRRNVTIEPIKLSVFDEIREALLTKPFMQEYSFKWDNADKFNNIIGRLGKLQNYTNPLEGLMVKTYQSDLLNNWMNTEWLDGDNGINAVTAVDTSSGSFDINSLIVARKTFDMLNRIAMSDGDYKGWQQAVYDHNGKWNIEQPLYIGGYSEEVVFQEVISNSASENEPLGTLAGRGMNINRRGDKIYFKADEAGYIMGIVSLTPRLDYSDGNDFDTYLDNMDDLHKPSLDGIAFQDLDTKQAAWWDGNANDKFSFGKQVAWQNYMTTINQVHGEFALNGDFAWMTLQRKYHERIEEGKNDKWTPYISDRSTYINPNDWNGIFADERDDGQNFWLNKLQIADFRRVMAAKQIPNL